ncbi:MAG: hypothetical protein LJE67_11760 [Salaquimonas sp.]|jgi:DMSO/TMAO reductase YedYZ molybdopterin-dependent catalytic subunit|nr:hypothetical protein [Salaquimonas sp.]
MKKLVFALSVLGLAASPALVTSNAMAATMDFNSVDANGDGQVTLIEANDAGLQWTEEQFAAADVDHSGGLSETEFNAVAG